MAAGGLGEMAAGTDCASAAALGHGLARDLHDDRAGSTRTGGCDDSLLTSRIVKSSETWIAIPGPLLNREARKPVPNQVPTTPVLARPRPTPSDGMPCLNCGNRTTRDALRRN